MKDLLNKLIGKKKESSCCNIEIKEVQENETEKKESCCNKTNE